MVHVAFLRADVHCLKSEVFTVQTLQGRLNIVTYLFPTRYALNHYEPPVNFSRQQNDSWEVLKNTLYCFLAECYRRGLIFIPCFQDEAWAWKLGLVWEKDEIQYVPKKTHKNPPKKTLLPAPLKVTNQHVLSCRLNAPTVMWGDMRLRINI